MDEGVTEMYLNRYVELLTELNKPADIAVAEAALKAAHALAPASININRYFYNFLTEHKPDQLYKRCALLSVLAALDPVAYELGGSIRILSDLNDESAFSEPQSATDATAGVAGNVGGGCVVVSIPYTAPRVRPRMPSAVTLESSSNGGGRGGGNGGTVASDGNSSSSENSEDDGHSSGVGTFKRKKSSLASASSRKKKKKKSSEKLSMNVQLEVLALEAACSQLDYAGQHSTVTQWEELCSVVVQVHSSFLPSMTPAARTLPCWRHRLRWWVNVHFERVPTPGDGCFGVAAVHSLTKILNTDAEEWEAIKAAESNSVDLNATKTNKKIKKKRGKGRSSARTGSNSSGSSTDFGTSSDNEVDHTHVDVTAGASAGATAGAGASAGAGAGATAAAHANVNPIYTAAEEEHLYRETLKAVCAYHIYGVDANGAVFPFVADHINLLLANTPSTAALIELLRLYHVDVVAFQERNKQITQMAEERREATWAVVKERQRRESEPTFDDEGRAPSGSTPNTQATSACDSGVKIVVNARGRFDCPHCGRDFTSKQHVRRHVNDNCPAMRRPSVFPEKAGCVCVCGTGFSSKLALAGHRARCRSAKYDREKRAGPHQYTPNADGRYECQYCDATFSRSRAVARHQLDGKCELLFRAQEANRELSAGERKLPAEGDQSRPLEINYLTEHAIKQPKSKVSKKDGNELEKAVAHGAQVEHGQCDQQNTQTLTEKRATLPPVGNGIPSDEEDDGGKKADDIPSDDEDDGGTKADASDALGEDDDDDDDDDDNDDDDDIEDGNGVDGANADANAGPDSDSGGSDDGGAGPADSGGGKKAEHTREATDDGEEGDEGDDDDDDAIEVGNAAGNTDGANADRNDGSDTSDDDDQEGGGSGLLLRQASLRRDDEEDMTDPGTYKEGEVVWVKMAGYQYWPSIVARVSGKKGKKGKAKLYFNTINDGPEDKHYSIELCKVGKCSGGKPPARDVQRFKGATMQEIYKKALSCRTLKEGGDRDAALLEDAFKRAKRIIQEQANGSDQHFLPSHKRQKISSGDAETSLVAQSTAKRESSGSSYGTSTAFSDEEEEEQEVVVETGAGTNPNGADEEPLTEEDKEILRLRAPFEDNEACEQALRDAEDTIRGIVAGTVPCELYDRYKREGSNFQNTLSTGPFKNDDAQIEPLSDVLCEWFPGRAHFKLINDVLLEEALVLIVQKIISVSAADARTFIEDRQWMTSRERSALAKTCRTPVDDAPDSGEDSSDVD